MLQATWYAVVHAAWKLKPPVTPSMSSTSPAKKSPGTLRLSSVEGLMLLSDMHAAAGDKFVAEGSSSAHLVTVVDERIHYAVDVLACHISPTPFAARPHTALQQMLPETQRQSERPYGGKLFALVAPDKELQARVGSTLGNARPVHGYRGAITLLAEETRRVARQFQYRRTAHTPMSDKQRPRRTPLHARNEGHRTLNHRTCQRTERLVGYAQREERRHRRLYLMPQCLKPAEAGCALAAACRHYNIVVATNIIKPFNPPSCKYSHSIAFGQSSETAAY